jgi:predicted RNase H-like HicB family nuclease
MERIVNIRVEKLPEGVYLATSDEVQGLVAQGRTISETLEIARDVARRLLEAQAERESPSSPPIMADAFDYPLVVSD